MWDFPLFPEQASTVAGHVDALYYFLVAITAFFSLLIAFAIAFFAVKYRRGSKADRSNPISESKSLEAIWIAVPLAICMVIFFWGAKLYFMIERPPAHAEDIYATGKQWMWKFQHIGGQSEINEIHIPVGRAIKLTMTSEDVIHSLYVPAFRVKQDVLPGRYTQMWFEGTKAGTYHLFCAEYCGTEHSGMIGRVIVMEPGDYERWLQNWTTAGPGTGGAAGGTMMSAGERIFQQQGCNTCHIPGDVTRAPDLAGLFNKSVSLKSGGTVVADADYIRESILLSGAKIVAGYEPVMPTYQGRISEEDVMQLIAYIKSMGGATTDAAGTTGEAQSASPSTGSSASGAAAVQEPAGGQSVPQQQASGSTMTNQQPSSGAGQANETSRRSK